MRGIDNNVAARNLMDNTTKKNEARIREIYNAGYNTGFADGVREATEKIVLKITEQESDTNGDKP